VVNLRYGRFTAGEIISCTLSIWEKTWPRADLRTVAKSETGEGSNQFWLSYVASVANYFPVNMPQHPSSTGIFNNTNVRTSNLAVKFPSYSKSKPGHSVDNRSPQWSWFWVKKSNLYVTNLRT